MNNETIWRWLAFKLPRTLALWCYIRVMASATRAHSKTHPDNITYEQAYKAWVRR